MSNVFIAFPSNPTSLTELYHAAIANQNIKSSINFIPWTKLSVSGQLIWSTVLSSIRKCDIFCADITSLNQNVVYEIGYAIGLRKPIYLFLNSNMADESNLRTRLGIFDTIGYEKYSNLESLVDKLSRCNRPHNSLFIPNDIDRRSPVYLLDAYPKDGLVATIFTRVKKDIVNFRSFDPQEQVRLPVDTAIREIAKSVGVIVSLLPSNFLDSVIHNFRASFIAGLANGLEKELLILQIGDRPTPLDFREDASECFSEEHISKAIDRFSISLLPMVQQISSQDRLSGHSLLEKLQVGASVAENEFRDLSEYYLRTDAFLRAERGEARVIIGRKGAGKTALFAQLRDEKRKNRQNLVVDLKPEGYKLLKFRDDVLSLLQIGTLNHIITAFWDYVLLLELAYKLLENDRKLQKNNHEIHPYYQKLKDIYFVDSYHSEGDFSERLSALLEDIAGRFSAQNEQTLIQKLNNMKVAEIIYSHPIAELRECLTNYLRLKNEVWILIDNIDKGWPSDGLTSVDISLVRCLIEGVDKLKRQLTNRAGVPCTPIIFLRNDVFERLIEHSSDRGKTPTVSVDWTDRDSLKEMLRLRFIRGGIEKELSFDEAWSRIAVASVGSSSSIDFLLDRALMRPRSLIDLFMACKSNAVNRKHQAITETDFRDGYKNYSLDMVENISLEIRDVAPEIKDSLYIFIDQSSVLKLYDLRKLIKSLGITESTKRDALIDLFLWYGVLGVKLNTEKVEYIYTVNYNFRMLKTMANRQGNSVRYVINPAFRGALSVLDRQ